MIKEFIGFLCELTKCTKKEESVTKYNEDTVKTILEAAKTEYAYENERNKHVEEKAKSLITLSGVLITISLSIIKAINDNGWFTFLVFALLIIVLFLVIAIWMLLQMLKMRDFHKLPLNNIVTVSEMRKDNSEVMAAIAASYEESILKNKEIIDDKVKTYNRSVGFVEGSTIFLILISAIIAFQNTDYVQYKLKSNKEFYNLSNNHINNCYVCHLQLVAAEKVINDLSVKPIKEVQNEQRRAKH